jgi:dolichyl-phosphate-mannose-protein mannosyltransferase
VAGRWLWPGILAAALLAAAALRVPAVGAGYPYLAYVDEGHVLRPAQKQIVTGRWLAAENHYPQLPSRAIAAATRLTAAVAAPFRSEPLLAHADLISGHYDAVDPPELVLVGRALSVLLSLGIVALAGLYARRLAGDGAGAVAATAAALLPALVLRGSIVIVDVYTSFFALAALAVACSVREPRQWPRVLLAGACCGLVLTSKYPAAMVGIAVVVELLLLPWSWRQRLTRAAAAALAGAGAASLAMPSLLVDGAVIWRGLLRENAGYSTHRSPSYWDQAVHRAEWDLHFERPEVGLTFMVLALAGIVVAVVVPRWRRDGIAWSVFAALMVGFHARYAFQPFRHLLPVAAVCCVAVGVLAGWLGERLRRPVAVAAGAVALLVALFVPADVRYVVERARLRDSRTLATEWLLRHRRPGQSLVVVRPTPMAFVELRRLGGKVELWNWEVEARPLVQRAEPRFLLVGDLVHPDLRPLISGADREWLLRAYEVRATFGTDTGPAGGIAYPDNRLRVYVLERRPGARRSRKPANSAETGANSSSGKFTGLSQNSPKPPAPQDS